MIYECPHCQSPQKAGQIACPHCQAQFDGPVPDDAEVPFSEEPVSEEPVSEEAAPLQAAETADPAVAELAGTEPGPIPSVEKADERQSEEPHFEEPQTAETRLEETRLEGKRLEEVKPPPVVVPPSPYFTPSSYSPPPYIPPPAAPPPTGPPLGRLTRALLIAFPIVLVLVLGGVYFAGTLNTEPDTTPVIPAVVQTAAPPPPAVPVGSPLYLQGGQNTSAGADSPRHKMLEGRWQAANGTQYTFNSNGTGLRGNPAAQQADQSFLWGLVQNRLMLYMDKNETLRFNPGPNDDTIFLAPENGQYLQYTRAKS